MVFKHIASESLLTLDLYLLDYPVYPDDMNPIKTLKIDDATGIYRTNLGNFPRVNKILKETMPGDRKQKLAAWAISENEKWVRSKRKCMNCTFWENSKCTADPPQKPRPPEKLNRCKAFKLQESIGQEYNSFRSKAMEAGTTFHKCLETFFLSGVFPNPSYCPQAQHAKFFLNNLQADYICVEEPLVSLKHKYAGTADFIGNYQDEVILIDWTTTHRPYVQRENYEDKFLQCAAYAIAAEETLKIKIDRLMVCVFTPKKAHLFKEDPDKLRSKWLKRLGQYHAKYPQL